MKPSVLSGGRPQLLVWLVLNGLCQAAVGIGLAQLMNELLSGAAEGREDASHGAVTAILLCSGAVFLVSLRIYQRRDSEALGLSYVHDLRMSVLGHMLRLPMSSRSPALGPMLTRLTNDLLAVKNWVSYGIAGSIVSVVVVSASLAFLYQMEPRLAVSSLLAICVACVSAAMAVPFLDLAVRNARNLRGRLSRRIGEKLVARATIVALSRTQKELRLLDDLSRQLTDELIKRAHWGSVVRFAALAALPLSIAIYWGLERTFPVGLHVGAETSAAESKVLAWVFVMSLALTQLQDAFRGLDYRINFRPAILRVDTLLAMPGLPDGGSLSLGDLSASVTLEISETSSADQTRTILVPRGTHVALRSVNARSRSHFMRKLAWLEAVGQGECSVNGVDLVEIPFMQHRSLIALVAPELPLLPGSIGGNLRKALGKRFSDTAELRVVLELVDHVSPSDDLDQFLDSPINLDNGNRVGDRISRLQLAAALLRKPRLLLLDDPVVANQPALLRRIASFADRAGTSIIVSCDGEADVPAGWIRANFQ